MYTCNLPSGNQEDRRQQHITVPCRQYSDGAQSPFKVCESSWHAQMSVAVVRTSLNLLNIAVLYVLPGHTKLMKQALNVITVQIGDHKPISLAHDLKYCGCAANNC